MIIVKIDNSTSHLSGTTVEQWKALSAILSYTTSGTIFAARKVSYWDGSVKLLQKSGTFPTGLWPLVSEYLEAESIAHQVIDNRRPPKPWIDIAFDMSPPFPPRYYQYDASKVTDHRNRGVFVMGTGCLSGDTIINLNRNGKGYRTTLRAAYKGHNNLHSHKKYNWNDSKTMIRSFDGERIRLHEALDFVESGVKDTFSLTLENDFHIMATACHKFLTKDGFKRLDELTYDDEVVCEAMRKKSTQKPKKLNYKQINGLKSHPYAGKTVSNEKIGNWIRGRMFRVPLHRIVAEARDSMVSVNEFIERCKNGNIDGLIFYDPSIFAVHHINHNHEDNSPENLMVCTHEDHLKFHGDYSRFGQGNTVTSKVRLILPIGKEMTYDVVCADPHHNFVANGMVVHNSGKTLTAALIIRRRCVPTLFIAPDTGLRDQVYNNFLEWFGEDCVSTDIKSNKGIVVTNIQALANKKPEVFEKFHMLMIDEFHHCIHGDTKITGSPTINRKTRTIKQIYDLVKRGFKPTVSSWDGIKWVSKPVVNAFKYHSNDLLKIKVETEDGKIKEMLVTRKHKFLTEHGKIEIGSMKIGDEVVLGVEQQTLQEHLLKLNKSKEHREIISTTNAKRSDVIRNSQALKMKKHMQNGLSPYGRGRYGNGGDLTPTQTRVMQMIGGTPEFSVALKDSQRPHHYRIDVAFPEHRLAIEIDGSSHKNRKEQDFRKDVRLKDAGWKVVRIQENCSKDGLLALKKLVGTLTSTTLK